jgi:ABC-type nitrate/sulfonate/bicarbonate transport system ATPase subunit
MVKLEKVSFAYPGGGNSIFDHFDWEIDSAQSWAVLGPSGCGKTTLLYLLAGLVFPQSGNVSIDGQVLTRPRPQTGLVLQDYGLLPWATVAQNVNLGLQMRDFYGPDGKHAPRPAVAIPTQGPDFWLRRLGITDVSGAYPGQLSGGQRQRTAIARTLVLQPDLLLMDEPFSSLDPLTRKDLQSLTLQLWREAQFTFVMVTHAIEEALIMGQSIMILGGPPGNLMSQLTNPLFGQPVDRDSLVYRQLFDELQARLGAG